MAHRILLDLGWASLGYLCTPPGEMRFVIGLDRLAVDTKQRGVKVYWADIPYGRPALASPEGREIMLAPWLFRSYPVLVRRAWSEELAHCVVGHCEERANTWQRAYYQTLIEPLPWAM